MNSEAKGNGLHPQEPPYNYGRYPQRTGSEPQVRSEEAAGGREERLPPSVSGSEGAKSPVDTLSCGSKNRRLDELSISGTYGMGDWYKGNYNRMKEDYLEYLDMTANQTIDVQQYNPETLETRTLNIPYLHRWSVQRKKQILAKLYKLEAWYNQEPKPVTLLTFTTKQADFSTYEEQYSFLKANYQRLRLNIKKMKGTIDYFWVIEPHKSGFIHLHMMAFTTFTDSEKQRIKTLWCDNYQAGVQDAQDIADIQLDKVNHLRSYLFKYLAKSFDEDAMQNDGYLTMSAVAWNMSKRSNTFRPIRFYGSSQHLSKVMRLDRPPTDEEWTTISSHFGDRELYNLPAEEKEEILSIINKAKEGLDDLQPIPKNTGTQERHTQGRPSGESPEDTTRQISPPARSHVGEERREEEEIAIIPIINEFL